MKVFESVVILKPTLDIKEFNCIMLKLRDTLQRWNKTKRVLVEEMGEKKLAYPIGGYDTGYYILFTFECEPVRITEFEKLLREDDNVTKFIVTESDKDRDDLEDIPAGEAVKSEQPYKPEGSTDVLDLILGLASEPDDHSCSHSPNPEFKSKLIRKDLLTIKDLVNKYATLLNDYCENNNIDTTDRDDIEKFEDEDEKALFSWAAECSETYQTAEDLIKKLESQL